MRTPRDNDRRLLRFAQELRENSTDAERKLWSLLRGRKLAGFKFRRQYPVGGYILDFYCIRAKLALELDGSQHSHADAIAYDQRRKKRLSELGVRVIRFWDHDVLKDPDAIAATVYRELSALMPGEALGLDENPERSPAKPSP